MIFLKDALCSIKYYYYFLHYAPPHSQTKCNKSTKIVLRIEKLHCGKHSHDKAN